VRLNFRRTPPAGLCKASLVAVGEGGTDACSTSLSTFLATEDRTPFVGISDSVVGFVHALLKLFVLLTIRVKFNKSTLRLSALASCSKNQHLAFA